MTEKDAGAPCPPVEDEDLAVPDNFLAHESHADYSAEETNAKEVKST